MGKNQMDMFPGLKDRNKPKMRAGSSKGKTIGAYGRKIFEGIQTIKLLYIVLILLVLVIITFIMGVEQGKKDDLARSRFTEEAGELTFKIAGEDEDSIADEAEAEADDSEAAVKEAEAKLQPAEVAKKYTVQVAAFKNKESARKDASELSDLGYDNVYVIKPNPKSVWYSVCMGEFFDIDEAKGFLGTLKKDQKRFKDAFLRNR